LGYESTISQKKVGWDTKVQCGHEAYRQIWNSHYGDISYIFCKNKIASRQRHFHFTKIFKEKRISNTLYLLRV
jgi:hypothetical protein